jgi:hypothetical protein
LAIGPLTMEPMVHAVSGPPRHKPQALLDELCRAMRAAVGGPG